ncbi:uncharacterized protein Rnb [Chelonus insularis]|uniref:uncharacterized protein Rnb n=1 Tax=Chelonus insularis TaxID=460826 RepID=UPI001589227D|nr:uncharacterized protein LOC118068480 [Chelonus insularis]
MSLHDRKLRSSVIEELSDHVSSRSKHDIIACLNTVKNDPKIFDDFCKGKGLDILIKLLKYQNARILDITLSILANAFLESSIREEVRDSKLAHNVIWIIKNINSNGTLHCRACRLISNLVQSERHATIFCEAGVINVLNGIIIDSTSSSTLLMAVRAVRNIWITNEKSRQEIINLQLIRGIADLLEQSNSSKHKQLSDACLKALIAFANSTNPIIGEQINGMNSRGFTCISELCKANNKTSFQLLYTLCQVADHRPNLGCVGVVECLIDILETQRTSGSISSLMPEIIKSFCLFAREAVNRMKIRCAGGLELMLNLLKDIKIEVYHPSLLHALTQFIGDEHSILIMIKNGIVNILVDRLKIMVLDNRLEAKNHSVTRKRSADVLSSSNDSASAGEIKHNRTSNGRFSLDFHSNQLSPSSSTSSPPNSPPLTHYMDNDILDEDNYSPVCSDTDEWIDNDENTAQEEVDSLTSYASTNIGRDDECSVMLDILPNTSKFNYAHMWTLSLLVKLTLWSDPIEGLADSSTIQALMAYIDTSKHRVALLILYRITRNHVYFMPLLLQGFVFKVQLLENFKEYLEALCTVAESGGAFGSLSTTLLRGKDSDKYIVAVSVPFLLRSKDKLKTLLDNYGGLELIFKLLANPKHLLNKNAILSICQLADVLGVVPEIVENRLITVDPVVKKHSDSNFSNHSVEHAYKLKNKKTVTFELDDGRTVNFCRKTLCIKSSFFSAMLEGNFSEGGKQTVSLPNVTKEGLIALCLAASGHLFNGSDKDEKIKIEALLEAALLADKYLMGDESAKLTEISISRLTSKNLNRAWNWARINYCSELKICCAKNILTLKMSHEDRMNAFRDFYVDQNFDEFLQDLRSIVMTELLVRN